MEASGVFEPPQPAFGHFLPLGEDAAQRRMRDRCSRWPRAALYLASTLAIMPLAIGLTQR